MRIPLMIVFSVIVGLTVTGSFADTNSAQVKSEKSLYISSNVIFYNAKTLSPNKRLLLFGEWDLNKKSGVLAQRVKIIDVTTGVIVSELSLSSKDRMTGFLNMSTVNWGALSDVIYYTVTGDDDKIMKWDLASNEHGELLSLSIGIVNFSVSPDGKRLAYIEKYTDSHGKLYIHDFDIGRKTGIRSEIDYHTIVWKSESVIIFSEYNVLMTKNLSDSSMDKVAALPKGNVLGNEVNAKGQLYVISSHGLDLEQNEPELMYTSVREIWRYDILSKESEKIIAFRSESPGVAIKNDMVVIPLFKAYDESQLISYDVSNKLLQPVIVLSKKNDLPLFADDNILIYRAENNTIRSALVLQ